MKKIIFTLFAAGFTNLVSAAVPRLRLKSLPADLTGPCLPPRPTAIRGCSSSSRGAWSRSCKMERCCRPHSLICQLRSTLPASAAFWDMTFDPGFATNRRFYVDYIDKTTLNTVVATYQASASQPNIADTATAQTVLTVAQPEFTNHKAGWIGFRPGEDTNLYIATGDGGSANDPQNRAQNLHENLGKILRVDVSADRLPADNTQYGYAIPTGNIANGNPEIYASGLRNPFRDSFDRETGTFYIADVGQSAREEINIGAAGANYGWRKFEGTLLNFPNDPAIPNHTPPIFEYNNEGTAGVIGGYVYRGAAIEGLQGTYFFADLATDKVTSFRFTGGGGVTELTDRTAELISPTGISGSITSFGEDGFGNIYLVSFDGGKVGMITAIPEPGAWAMMLAGMALISVWARRRGHPAA